MLLAGMLDLVFVRGGSMPPVQAAALASSLSAVYAVVCLSSWYVCRRIPLRDGQESRVAVAALAAAFVSASVWIAASRGLAALFAATTNLQGWEESMSRNENWLLALGSLIYLLAISFHYLVAELDAAREAKNREVRIAMMAREAELKALREQIRPHFLFNSLNSISALTSVDQEKARRMCIQLADFLRMSLSLGERKLIQLAEELAMVRHYLSVEQVRFSRMEIEENIELAATVELAPPLILQPLVENAVKHGISESLEGGTIRIEARIGERDLLIAITNTCDGDAPRREGAGVGLANVRKRLATIYGGGARLDVRRENGLFRAEIRMLRGGVDDEALARAVLREMLDPGIEVVAECANGFEAVKASAEARPDLILLDVQMPKLDGFEVLELVGADVAVVFVTAYDSYAMRAFEVHAVDYLLKPFTRERLETAIERARERIGQKQVSGEALSAAARGPKTYLERIVTRDGAKVHIIPVEKIDYVEAQEDYIALRTEGRNILKQQTLSSLEESLDPARFVRIHRSYLVRLDRIDRVEAHGRNSRLAVLHGGVKLPVSRSGFAKLEELWNFRGGEQQ